MMEQPMYGITNLRAVWGPWLRGEEIKKALASLAGLNVVESLAYMPGCLTCGCETTFDQVALTYNCHRCKKAKTRQQYLQEAAERMRLAALAKWAANVTESLEPDEPLVVGG